MKVKCPGCERAYKVDDNRLPQDGLVMRCPRCSQSFRVHTSGAIKPIGGKSSSSSVADQAKETAPSIVPKRPSRPHVPPPPPPKKTSTKLGVSPANAPMSPPLDIDLPTPKVSNDDPFGEFDLSSSNNNDVDLPVPVGAKKNAPIAHAATQHLSTRNHDDFELNNSDPFASVNLSGDTVDLPTPVGSTDLPGLSESVDLPTPVGSTDLPGLSESVDLPTPVGSTDLPGLSESVDLPTPVGKMEMNRDPFGPSDQSSNSIDIIDLPGPTSGNRPPAMGSGDAGQEIDLPAPAGWAGESSAHPESPLDFGGVQIASDPPIAAPLSAPPAPPIPRESRDTFGEIDFGDIGSEVRGNQSPSHTPPPMDEAEESLGTPSPPSIGSDPFAGLDDMFGAPVLDDIPSPADAIGLPPAMDSLGVGDAFDLPPLGSSVIPEPPGLPSSPPGPAFQDQLGPGLPSPIGSGFDAPLGSAFDPQPINLADSPYPGESAASPGDVDDEFRFSLPEVQRDSAEVGDFAGINLGTLPDQAPSDGASEFDAFPTNQKNDDVPSGVHASSGLDLDTEPHPDSFSGNIVDAPTSKEIFSEKKPNKGFEGRRKQERKDRLGKLILLASLIVVILSGAAMTWTPLGPFGTTALAKLLPNVKSDELVKSAVLASEKALSDDTLSSANQAISEFQIVLNELPNNEDIHLYGAYLYHWIQIRFGVDKGKDQTATKLLEGIQLTDSESPFANLAKSAQDLRMGKASASAKGITGPTMEMKGGLALLVSAQLSTGEFKKALTTANSFFSKEKSPRAAHLLARATFKASQPEIALKKLEELSSLYPNHSEIKLLLAEKLLASRPLQPVRILELTQSISENALPKEKAQAHALRGRVYYIERKLDQASQEFNAAEKLAPENLDMLLGKGNMHLLNSDWSSAASLFNKASSIDSKNLEAALGKAAIQLGEGHLTESKAVLLQLAGTNPDSTLAHFLLGRVHMALKNEEQAKAELEKAIELDSQFLEPYIALSELHLAANRDDEAMKALDAASAAAPGSPLINHALAQAHATRGDHASAIVELNKAVDLAPDNLRSHYLMAQMYQSMGALDDASRALDEVAKRNPDYSGLAIARGRLLEKGGDTEKALKAYEKALADLPDDPLAKIAIGATSHKLGDNKRAEQLLSEALSQVPKSAEANFYLGEVYRTTERFIESAPLLKRASELDKGNPVYHLRYAQTLMANNDGIQAMRELEHAKRLAPDMAEPYVRMGQIRLRQGSPKDAIEFLDKALSLDPQFADAYGLVAEAFEQLSDLRSSVAYYRRAVAAIPNSADLFFKLALVELRVHGQRAAIAPLSSAVRVAESAETKPKWFPEALYRLGSVQAAAGSRTNAISSFKRYLEIAPEEHIDRADALGQLDRLGSR